MRHTIELSQAGEENLRRLAREAGRDEGALLRDLAETVLGVGIRVAPSGGADVVFAFEGQTLRIEAKSDLGPIRWQDDVLGGDARIRDTRIPVWLVVAHKKWGESDSEILAQYEGLNAADLSAAWDFYAAHTERVDAERRAQEEAE